MSDSVSFSNFPARFYLEKYYSAVGVENGAFMRAAARAVQPLDDLGTVVELGGGPSLCGLFAMAAATRTGPERVIWADVAQSNLMEVRAWLSGASEAFDYTAVLRWAEREFDADAAEVERRLRHAKWDIRPCDLWNGLPPDLHGAGDVVGSYFLAEAATGEEHGFVEMTSRIAEAASEGARIALAYIRRSQPYRLNDGVVYPAFSLDEGSLPSLLERAGLTFAEICIESGPLEDPPARPGYDGMVFVTGRLVAG